MKEQIVRAWGCLPIQLFLGKRGEHLVRRILFDCAGLKNAFGAGRAELLVLPPDGNAPYPAVLEASDDVYIWNITASDTAAAGAGCCELRWYAGEALAKSVTFPTRVLSALDDEEIEQPPEAAKGWVDQVLEAGADAQTAADRAVAAAIHQPTLGENGTWLVWNPEAGAYEDTGTAASRVFLPTASRTMLGGILVGDNLSVTESGVLSVDVADSVEADNTRPITAAAVYGELGNIEALMGSI